MEFAEIECRRLLVTKNQYPYRINDFAYQSLLHTPYASV